MPRLRSDAPQAYITLLTARVRSVTAWNCVYKLRRAAELIAPKADFSWLAEIEKDLALVMEPRSKFDRLGDRAGLIAEVAVYGRIGADDTRLVSGRADAVRFREGRAQIVFDWKSDVAPDPAMRAAYANQLALYVKVLDAERGAIVYMTSGQIQWVDPTRGPGVDAPL